MNNKHCIIDTVDITLKCFSVFQVGNCVARRNYRYFYLFLMVVCVFSIFVMGVNITVIVLGELSRSSLLTNETALERDIQLLVHLYVTHSLFLIGILF